VSQPSNHHSKVRRPEPAPGLTDHAFERLLDAHADGALTDAARRALEQELARSPERQAAFERAERLHLAMRQPIEAPDLTASILGQLEDRGIILPSRKRRVLYWSRIAAGVALAAGVVGLVLQERHAPGSTPIASESPAPVSSMVEASRSAVDTGASQVRQAVATLQTGLLPAAQPSEPKPRALGLKLGSSSSGEAPRRWTLGSEPASSQALASKQDLAPAAILSERAAQPFWVGMDMPLENFWPSLSTKLPAKPLDLAPVNASATPAKR